MKKYSYLLISITLSLLVVHFTSCKKNSDNPSDNLVTVTFDANGGKFSDGSEKKDTTITKGGKINAPQAPVNGDNIFFGWFNNNTKWIFSDAVNGDMTLTANWKDAEEVVVVSFRANGGKFADGSERQDTIITKGCTVKVPFAPSKDNSSFQGWYDGTKRWDFYSYVNSNITLTAGWKDGVYEERDVYGGLVFYAGFPDDTLTRSVESGLMTKTQLDGKASNGVLWVKGDTIFINQIKYIAEEGGVKSSKFTKLNPEDSDPQKNNNGYYVVIYPKEVSSERSGVYYYDLEGSWGSDPKRISRFPMVSESDTTKLQFHNSAVGFHIVDQSGGASNIFVAEETRALWGEISFKKSGDRWQLKGSEADPGKYITLTLYQNEAYFPLILDDLYQLTFLFTYNGERYLSILGNCGNSFSFQFGTMKKITLPTKNKAINAKYPISAGKNVNFARGNLFYDEIAKEWGTMTSQTNYTLTPLNKGEECPHFREYFSWGEWQGTGAESNGWRVLSYDEWYYLLKGRPGCNDKKSAGMITMHHGMSSAKIVGEMIIPEDFDDPCVERSKENNGYFVATNDHGILNYYNDFETFPYTRPWSLMEAAGALFLTRSGGYNGGIYVDDECFYWTNTSVGDSAWCFHETKDKYELIKLPKSFKASVRMAKDL